MPLKLSLKPGEKFVLNGAVVQNGDRRTVVSTCGGLGRIFPPVQRSLTSGFRRFELLATRLNEQTLPMQASGSRSTWGVTAIC